MPDVLVAEGLSRSFRAGGEVVVAVRDASLRVGERELVPILGRSGAGKSSFLFLCGGLDRPTAGRVVVAGQDVGALGDAALERFLRRTVGWVFQSPGLLPLLTAEENVALALRLLGRPLGAARAALDAVGAARSERPDSARPGLMRNFRARWAKMVNVQPGPCKRSHESK